MLSTIELAVMVARVAAQKTGRVQFLGGEHEDGGFDLPETWQESVGPPGGARLAVVLDDPAWLVYPSGLALPLRRVNWFWRFFCADGRNYYWQGSAEQARVAARSWKYDPATDVSAVWGVDIHGSCVFEAGDDLTVFSRDDPADDLEWQDWWTGMRAAPRAAPRAANRSDWRMVEARSFPSWCGV